MKKEYLVGRGRDVRRFVAFTLMGWLVAGVLSAGQDESQVRRLAEGESPQAAKASDLDWLAGHWKGTGLGGVCEEVWMPAAAGSMVGAFRLVKEGELQFFEFLTIMEIDDSLVLRVKHFNDDMVGWETKEESVDFPLVAWSPNEAFFSGLTIRRHDERLEMYLAMSNSSGKRWEEKFLFQKVN